MSGDAALQLAAQLALTMLGVALLLAIARLILGPSLADRILALDLITTLAIGVIGTIAVLTGFSLYIDIAIALGLLGFLTTLALVRYLLSREMATTSQEQEEQEQ